MRSALRFAPRLLLALALALGAAACRPAPVNAPAGPASGPLPPDATRLPTGVYLDPVGAVIPVGPLPLAMIPTPGNRRVALVLSGWARQGVQIVDWRSGRVTQTLEQPAAFIGITFSPDGQWLYASGGNQDAIYRYRWAGDSAVLADSIPLIPRTGRASGRRYSAGIALSPDGRRLYVAENLADSVAVIDVATSSVVQHLPVGRYPYGVAVASDGTVYVSAWGGDAVSSFTPTPTGLAAAGTIPAGRHPSALLLNRSGSRLYVASASTDQVAVIDTKARTTVAVLHDPPPAGPSEGSTPNAFALSPDESRLYVAEADANSAAIFDLSASVSGAVGARGGDRLSGRIPTGWYPAALVAVGDTLLVANGKGGGTRANPDGPQPIRSSMVNQIAPGSAPNSTLGQLTGTVTVVPTAALGPSALNTLSARVSRANGWTAGPSANRFPHFEHVIYVIKENRTYDQVLGDLKAGDGDSSLVYFPRAVSPNHHALADRFGVFDRFFVNAEVSADGHNWSTAAYAADYVEKTVESNYSSRRSPYDYEGMNKNVVPENDVNEPGNGYLWNLAEQKSLTFRNYGEFVTTERGQADASGARATNYRGVKPFLVGHTNPQYPGFNLDIQDQLRADIWLAELKTYVQQGSMPALEIVRLPNDHTSGGSAGKPTPRADMADNDLALGRMIAALSRTPFWATTVVFVLEDDAQNGPDHVDSHRSPLLVISPYNHPGAYHRFTNTTDVIRSIEGILGLSSLSQFDYFGRPLTEIWSATPDLTPYDALTPSVSLDEKNQAGGRGARESRRLKLDEEDESDDDDFSQIIWHVVKGWDVPYPGTHRMSLLEARRGH